MRRTALFGLVAGETILKVLGVVIFGGFLAFVVLNAIVEIGFGSSVFLVGFFFACLGAYTFYQHYWPS